ncbi:hypothetical protein Bbelb_392840 [Branchiostoma belcheri]|nr:hypothetical protein Bbelb_392840 [Branchiostoma belcheri]
MRLVSYWYENGCIFPDMGTVFIALDQATQENGCLKVIPGSQRVGRIDHVRVGDQVGADVERVTEVRKFLPLAHVEMEPGDALFFHCNLLHRSEQNHSDRRRWAFLVAYNRASNNPVMEHHHPRYTPMAKGTITHATHPCQRYELPNHRAPSPTLHTHVKGTNNALIEHYNPRYTPTSKVSGRSSSFERTFLQNRYTSPRDWIFRRHPRRPAAVEWAVPNTAIRECTTATEIAGKDFFDPATEVSLKKVTEKTQTR